MRRLRPKAHEESSKGCKVEDPDRFWSLIVAETGNASVYRVMPAAQSFKRTCALTLSVLRETSVDLFSLGILSGQDHHRPSVYH